jgi:hypothetical protein
MISTRIVTGVANRRAAAALRRRRERQARLLKQIISLGHLGPPLEVVAEAEHAGDTVFSNTYFLIQFCLVRGPPLRQHGCCQGFHFDEV